jgi:hypothetical protein
MTINRMNFKVLERHNKNQQFDKTLTVQSKAQGSQLV